MVKNRDFRVQRTYDALCESFRTLLTEKGFENITIKELCEKAHIRPATFYTHFKDKYDFFAFVVREIREQYFDVSSVPAGAEDSTDYLIRLMERGFDFVEQNQMFLQAIDADSMLPVILHSVTDKMNEDIQTLLEYDKNKGAVLLAKPELLTQLFVGSMMQCTRWWLMHQGNKTKEEMSEELEDVIRKCIQWP